MTINTCLKGNLAEVYLGFQKIEEIIHVYEETRDYIQNNFNQYMLKLFSFTNKFGIEEK